MRFKWLIFIIIFIYSTILTSQNTWLRILDFGRIDDGIQIYEEEDGSFIIGGNHTIDTQDTLAPAFYKLDKNGHLLWHKIYKNGSCDAKLSDFVKTIDGYLGVGFTNMPGNACGFSPNPPPADHQILLTKIDFNGNLLFQKSLGDTTNYTPDEAKCIIHATPNNFFIGGTQSYKPILYKINNQGDTLWTKKYAKGQYITALLKVNDNFFLATVNNSTSTTLMKLDSTGAIIWDKFYTFKDIYNIKRVGNDFLLCTSNSNNKARLIRVDYQGNLVWDNSYNSLFGFRDLTVLDDDSYVSISSKNISKLNSDGSITWKYNHYPDTTHYLFDIYRCKDNGFLLTGSTKDLNFFALKLDCEGRLEWDTENCPPEPLVNSFNTFPNPVSNILNIEIPNINTQSQINISLYDNLGRIIRNYNYTGLNKIEFNVNSYSSGVYLLKIAVDNTPLEVKKLIKL